jgi:hypothetical protein
VAYLLAHRPQQEVYETLDGAVRERLKKSRRRNLPRATLRRD